MKSDVSTKLVCLLVVIVLMPFFVVWNAYVLTILWSWFVVPTFGLEPISIPLVIGISTIIFLCLKLNIDSKKDDEIERLVEYAIAGVFKPAWALLIGWVASLFI